MATTTGSHSAGHAAPARSGGLSRWQKAIGVIGLVVVFWVGDRLYDVIERGNTAPGGGHGTGGSTPTNEPGSGEVTPGGGPTGHDRSRFGH